MFVFLLFMNSIIPLMMILFGFLWKNNPPKNINYMYGYTSSMSMKNQKTWDFAHKHNAKVWRRWGSLWLLVSIGLMLIFPSNYEKLTIGINWIGLALILISLIPTEVALRKNFDKDGNLK